MIFFNLIQIGFLRNELVEVIADPFLTSTLWETATKVRSS